MKYLDPKADPTFKKVFGRHPDLLVSLLNSLLPLGDDEQIQEIEYLQPELVPELYLHKNSIVDVLCKDICGRTFCVEMQMEWSQAFKQRVLFNASKLYVTQAMQKDQYSELRPVYSLNLVNDVFEHDLPDQFIHNYRIVHDRDSNRVIEGLHFTFIELPKFTPHSIAEKRMAVLWLRFLTEIDSNTTEPPTDLLDDPSIGKALNEVRVSAFTDAELLAYDKFWDSVRVEKTLQSDSYMEGRAEGRAEGLEKGLKKGLEKGLKKGRAEGLEKGRAEGEKQKAISIAKAMLQRGLDIQMIAELSGLTAEEVQSLT